MVVPLRSQARLWHSLLHWAYSALLRSTIHNGRLAAPNGLQRSLVHWTSASPVPRTARGEAPSHRARASCCSSVSFAASIPQFAMVVPLRSQVRLRLSLAHWAYYGLFPPLAAAFVRPLCEKGAFWLVAQPYEVALPKSLLFPEGKREVSRRSRDGGIVQTTAQERLLFFTDSQISAAARAHWATSQSAPVRGRTARYAGGGNRARSGCNGAACARFHPIRCPGGNRPAWRSPPD